MNSHRVLITGIGGNVGQGVLKSLRASSRKFHIVGIDMEMLSAGFSLVDRYYQTPRTSHPDFHAALSKIAKEEQLEAIYVCSPSELEFFATYKEQLETELDLSVFVNPSEVIQTGSDKLKTAEFLAEAGFRSPQTVLAPDQVGVQRLIDRCGFPVIVKPRDGFSSRNVFVVNSAAEIAAAATLVPNLIVQQYLPDDAAEYTAATLSGADKKVRAHIVLRRDLLQGTTYRTELVQNEKIDREVVKIVERLGAVGPCNLQFRLLHDEVYVFEINPRFSGTGGIRYLYGFNDCEMIFELFRLGIEVKRPELKKAVVLRYWNEVYIPDASFDDLRSGQRRHDGIVK
ncbi:MAG TPA: ATP-grasp domain-containing protein [Pyrinomonadaceae bacterium]